MSILLQADLPCDYIEQLKDSVRFSNLINYLFEIVQVIVQLVDQNKLVKFKEGTSKDDIIRNILDLILKRCTQTPEDNNNNPNDINSMQAIVKLLVMVDENSQFTDNLSSPCLQKILNCLLQKFEQETNFESILNPISQGQYFAALYNYYFEHVDKCNVLACVAEQAIRKGDVSNLKIKRLNAGEITSSKDKKKLNLPLIIGASAGGFVLLLILFYLYKKSSKRKRKRNRNMF